MDDQSTNQIPTQPQQPVEQAAWVPVTPGSKQPPVPTTVPKKGMPLFLKIMIGCGCIAALGVPAILILIVIVAINPNARINEAKERSAQAALRSVSESVSNCITAERAKGIQSQKIFST